MNIFLDTFLITELIIFWFIGVPAIFFGSLYFLGRPKKLKERP